MPRIVAPHMHGNQIANNLRVFFVIVESIVAVNLRYRPRYDQL